MHTTRAFLAVLALAAPTLAAPPETPKRPITNEYHGVAVTDDYQWLEDWDNPEVKAWSKAQNEHARQVLDALPSVPQIRERITELMSSPSVKYTNLVSRSDLVFALKFQPPKQQPFIVLMTGEGGGIAKPEAAKVVLDPNQLDPEGGTSIDWFVPSHDGKLLAVSLSTGGSETGDVSVFDVRTGEKVGGVVPGVNGGTAGGDLAWAPDNSGFFYSRYPRAGEFTDERDRWFNVKVYFHTLGEPTEKDRFELGKDFPRIAEITLDSSAQTGYVLATIQDGDGGHFAHHVRTPEGEWKQISTFGDRIVSASLGHGNDLFLVSRKDAPRGKILRLQLPSQTLKDAAVIVPEDASASIDTYFAEERGIIVTKNKLYVIDQKGGPNGIRVFNHIGQPQIAPIVPPLTSVDQIVPMIKDDVLIEMESFTTPPAWHEFRAASGDLLKTPLVQTSPADFSDCEVVRETATSKDGTKVPITILRRKGIALNGANPTLLYGYGGYGVSTSPGFRPARRIWLDQGGVFAIAHIRGGGELGDDWHYQGNLTKKQNVFDDFYACAKRMVELGYATPEKLALYGGSNGGLLMGAMITQHPDLARAVVSTVGIYDMLRVELAPNGEYNTTEFGTVKNPEHFKALYAYSPYHHVPDGATFPAILMMTGANDPRVDPMHSRKMTARLQAAVSPESDRPILLRTSGNTGHGIGSPLSARVEQEVDLYAFLFSQLGVSFQPKAGGGAHAGHDTK